MKNQIVRFTKILARSSFKFFLLLISGSVLSLMAVILALLLFAGNSSSDAGHMGHTGSGLGAVLSMFVMFTIDFWASVLLFSSLLLFPVLYFMVAQKTAIHTALHLLCKEGLTDWVGPKIEAYLLSLENRQTGLLKTTSDWSLLRLKLLEESRNDPQAPKMQKKVLRYLLKKVRLDDVALDRDNLSFSGILTAKLYLIIEDTTQPSYSLFLLLVGAHLALVATAIIF